jgi:hypothetical protein
MSDGVAAGVLGAFLTLLVASPARITPAREPCEGCSGVSVTSASSGGQCKGIVELTTLMERGRCDWSFDAALERLECGQRRACTVTITREWRDLLPEIEIDHCVTIGGRELCLFPRPHSGRGWGRTVRTAPLLPCEDEASVTFFAGNAGCDLGARAKADCKSCRGRV